MAKNNLQMLISVVLIIAALNWGSVAYLDTDLVKTLIPNADLERMVKGVVGLVGLYALYELLM